MTGRKIIRRLRGSDWTLNIVGIHVYPDTEYPDLYLLLVDDGHGHDIPVFDEDGYVLVFTDIKKAAHALKRAGNPTVAALRPIPTTQTYCVDIAETLDLLQEAERDESATILNFLNTYFDLVAATEYKLPQHYKRILHPLADQVTLYGEFATLLHRRKISRESVVNGVLWMVGAVTASSKLVG